MDGRKAAPSPLVGHSIVKSRLITVHLILYISNSLIMPSMDHCVRQFISVEEIQMQETRVCCLTWETKNFKLFSPVDDIEVPCNLHSDARGSDEMPSVSSGCAAVEASRIDEVIKAGTTWYPPALVAALKTIYAN